MVKTKDEELQDAQIELKLIERLEKERKESDRLYAIKLVEKIVFTLISLLLIAIIGALIKLVITQ